MSSQYKRVIFKLSGESLSLSNNGKIEQPFDFNHINDTASLIAQAHNTGVQICLVIGGGNIWRGRQAGNNMNAAVADQMGMLSTMLNCLCMADALRAQGIEAIVQSASGLAGFTDNFDMHKANEELNNGKIVLFALGLGNPFFTTDTAVVLRARQMNVDAILMAKNIDGVYTDDPEKNPNAKFIEDISYEECLKKQLKVMDSSAFALLMDSDIKQLRLFSFKDPKNLLRVLSGESLGTLLHS